MDAPQQPVATPATVETLRAIYSRLETLREPFLVRARSCAAITIPALLPPKGHTPTSSLPSPYQSTGSRGVNNLAAKLTLTQFPPNQPCFKLSMDEQAREKLGAQVGDVEKAFGKIERITVRDIETRHYRPHVNSANKHLLVTGNALVHDDDSNGSLRVFPLSQYVVQRDPGGTVLKIVVEEHVAPEALEGPLKEIAQAHLKDSKSPAKTVPLYTGVVLQDGRYEVWQEVCDRRVPDSEGSYPVDKCPWIAMRLIIVEGEDYGRSYVEEYFGDLMSLEQLSKALVLGSAAAARVVFLANPNGNTVERDFTEAETGDVITGSEGDIHVVQTDKRADFQTVKAQIDELKKDLAFAFLLNSAIQRNGERVTAEEIRFMANELDTSLGGLYSTSSQEVQLPLVRARLASLTRRGKIPQLPKDIVAPMITTGVDAIGRGNDFQKIKEGVAFIAETLGPEVVSQRLHAGELTKRVFAALGVEDDGLVKTDDEVQAEQNQQQQMQMQQAAVAPAINQAGQLARTQQPAQ